MRTHLLERLGYDLPALLLIQIVSGLQHTPSGPLFFNGICFPESAAEAVVVAVHSPRLTGEPGTVTDERNQVDRPVRFLTVAVLWRLYVAPTHRSSHFVGVWTYRHFHVAHLYQAASLTRLRRRSCKRPK